MSASPFVRFLAPAVLAAPLLMLAACSPPAAPPPLEGASIGGPFDLVGSDGKEVRWSDFDGKYRIVYFGYTWCPDVCPFDLNRMMLGFRKYAEENPDLAADIQPIFITIDPERDTPEKVGEYVANFGKPLIGLTGTPEAIDEAATNFAVFYSRGPDDPNIGYLMQHSNIAYLMGRMGEPIATLPVNESPDAVAAELAKWVS